MIQKAEISENVNPAQQSPCASAELEPAVIIVATTSQPSKFNAKITVNVFML